MRPPPYKALALRFTLALALIWFVPVAAIAQDTPAPSPAATGAAPTDQSRLWLVFGGTATTLRGDCQEDCPAHGTGAYLHSGAILANVGYRVNKQMDAGLEAFWAPATSKAGLPVRSTFVMGAVQYRPWRTHGFFLKAGMGMGFLRNFAYDASGPPTPAVSKALGLTYGAGWAYRPNNRLGLQVFGAQHVAALGEFDVGGTPVENLIANIWSVGAAVTIR